MSGMFSSPKAPDPTATANAQAAANSQAAQTQAELNMVNQVTPYGNLTYNQTGTNKDGTPQYTATQTLNPLQQSTLTNQQQLANNTSGIGLNYTDLLSGLSTNPFTTSSLGVTAPTGDQQYDKAAGDAYYNQQVSRLDPQWQQSQTQLQTQLTNQGIPQGSDAWNQAMNNFSLQKNDAYQSANNQATANASTAAQNEYNMQSDAYQKALSNALTVRDQPINELSSLLGAGGGVTNSTYVSTPQESVAAPNIAGLTEQNYQQNLAAKQAQNQAIGSLLGAGTSAAFAFSDIRLKTNIRPTGKAMSGIPVYQYAYKGMPDVMLEGVMAQDVAMVIPAAVMATHSGYLAVDYARL